jgi:hypothetical protein
MNCEAQFFGRVDHRVDPGARGRIEDRRSVPEALDRRFDFLQSGKCRFPKWRLIRITLQSWHHGPSRSGWRP